MHKTIKDITEMKGKEKITVLTGYDSTMVTLCDQIGRASCRERV